MDDKMKTEKWKLSPDRSRDGSMTQEQSGPSWKESKMDRIRHEAWRLPLDESKKENSLAAIRQAAEAKQLSRYPSFATNLWNQFRFQSWKSRAAQGAVLLSAMLLSVWLNQKQIADTDSITVCSVFLVFAGNICLSGVARLFSRHMAELEQTLYLNLKQMVCIRMLEAGILDLVILCILTGLTGRFNSAGTKVCLLYMLVPFLWSDVLYLHMLTAFRNGLAGYRQISAGILCGLLALFPVMLEDAYETAALPWWCAFGLAGALLLGAEIYGILGKIEGGDSLCLN